MRKTSMLLSVSVAHRRGSRIVACVREIQYLVAIYDSGGAADTSRHTRLHSVGICSTQRLHTLNCRHSLTTKPEYVRNAVVLESKWLSQVRFRHTARLTKHRLECITTADNIVYTPIVFVLTKNPHLTTNYGAYCDNARLTPSEFQRVSLIDSRINEVVIITKIALTSRHTSTALKKKYRPL